MFNSTPLIRKSERQFYLGQIPSKFQTKVKKLFKQNYQLAANPECCGEIKDSNCCP